MTPREEEPRIAVVIPCFNDGGLVIEAVESVRESEPVELVVVDDCSSDRRTQTVLEQIDRGPARVIRLDSNCGVGAARMEGLAASRARYVFPLDSDDLAEAGVLGEMADLLDADPGAGAAVGDILEFGDHDLLRAVPVELDPYRIAYTNEYPVTALFRRAVLDAVGGWSRDYVAHQGYEDWNLWMHLAERGERIIHLGPGRVGYRRRLHGPRLNEDALGSHGIIYRAMRDQHPALFSALRDHRESSGLSRPRKVLYPIVYGARGRLPLERRLKRVADRLGIWTNVRRP